MSRSSVSLAWITPLFELYCVAGPGASRNALAQSANKVVQWARREEERIFIIGGAVCFSTSGNEDPANEISGLLTIVSPQEQFIASQGNGLKRNFVQSSQLPSDRKPTPAGEMHDATTDNDLRLRNHTITATRNAANPVDISNLNNQPTIQTKQTVTLVSPTS